MDKLVCLSLLSFAGWGGGHYYGRLHGYDKDGEYKVVRLSKKLTEREAQDLNHFDYTNIMTYKAGMTTERMSRDAAIGTAMSEWREHYPDAHVLVRGTFGASMPKRILDGPKWFVEQGNQILDRAEEIGWWDRGHEDRMYDLKDQWEELVAQLA